MTPTKNNEGNMSSPVNLPGDESNKPNTDESIGKKEKETHDALPPEDSNGREERVDENDATTLRRHLAMADKRQTRYNLQCFECKEPVTREEAVQKRLVILFGNVWHIDHVKCAECKVSLSDVTFYKSPVDSRQPLCVDCHINHMNIGCFVCKKPVGEYSIEVGDHIYHIECFTCIKCNRPIAPSATFIRGAIDQQPYHKGCHLMTTFCK